VVGSCHRYYCPSLITALKLSELSRSLSAETPTNDQNKKSNINVKPSSLGNGSESEEKKTLFIFSAPNDLSNNLFKNCTKL
jgi:hypothetical protein